MNPNKYRALIEETARRLVAQAARKKPDLLAGTFPQQRAFLEDPARFKAAHCSRGAAKSYTAGIGLYEAMENFPGCSVFYVTKTHDMARNIMWNSVMKAIDRDFSLGIDFNETLLEGRHPNGATFRLTGIDGDRKQQDKLLGGKYKLVVLDEVAFFETDLTEIVYKTIIPATGRIGGSVWMMSTSSDYPRGLFFDATRPEKELRIKGWAVHEWQWWDNPYIREEMQKTVDELIAANPLIVETNHYKQHYLNLWVIDESKLVYRFNPQRNLITEAEWEQVKARYHPDLWTRILGGDTGWEDDNALVLTSYHLNDPNLYIPTSWAEKELTFDQFADHITADFMNRPGLDPSRVIIDGANKQGVESMRARSATIPFEYADKRDKATFIELMNSDFVKGEIKIVDNAANRGTKEKPGIIPELTNLIWATDGNKIKYPKKEDERLPNHRCDAMLYAWRLGFHYQSMQVKPKIVHGSKAWYEQQAVDIWQREREKLMKEHEQNQGDWPTLPEGWGT